MSKTRPCVHCGKQCGDTERWASEDALMHGVHCSNHIHPDVSYCVIDPFRYIRVTVDLDDAYVVMRHLDDEAYKRRMTAGRNRDHFPEASRRLADQAGSFERVADLLRHRQAGADR